MFLKEELKAWSVVIVCERTHYWVIWASQGLQIKEDGFNTLIPEAQGVCWMSGLYGEGAVHGAGLKNESALANIQ